MMKRALLLFLLLFAAVFARAQAPPIGTVDFYGLRTVSGQQVRGVLQLKEGDAVPGEKTTPVVEPAKAR